MGVMHWALTERPFLFPFLSLDGSSSIRLKLYCTAWLEADSTKLTSSRPVFGGNRTIWRAKITGLKRCGVCCAGIDMRMWRCGLKMESLILVVVMHITRYAVLSCRSRFQYQGSFDSISQGVANGNTLAFHSSRTADDSRVATT